MEGLHPNEPLSHENLDQSHLLMYTSLGQEHSADPNPNESQDLPEAHSTSFDLALHKEKMQNSLLQFEVAFNRITEKFAKNPIHDDTGDLDLGSAMNICLCFKRQANHFMQSLHEEKDPWKLSTIVDQFTFTCTIAQIKTLIYLDREDEAKELIEPARQFEAKLKTESNTARLHTCLGLLAYKRGDMVLAHAYTTSASRCAPYADFDPSENEHLIVLHDLSNPTLTAKARKDRQKAWAQLAHPGSKEPYTPASVDRICPPVIFDQTVVPSVKILPIGTQTRRTRGRLVFSPTKPYPTMVYDNEEELEKAVTPSRAGIPGEPALGKPAPGTNALNTLLTETVDSELAYKDEVFDRKVADMIFKFTGLKTDEAGSEATKAQPTEILNFPGSGRPRGPDSKRTRFNLRALERRYGRETVRKWMNTSLSERHRREILGPNRWTSIPGRMFLSKYTSDTCDKTDTEKDANKE